MSYLNHHEMDHVYAFQRRVEINMIMMINVVLKK